MPHTNHASHAVHSVHSVHSNTLGPTCTTVGTTFTKLDVAQAKANQTYWNDLKAKINSTRARWGLSTTAAANTYTPPVNGKSLASEWNSYIRDNLNTAPMNSFGTAPSTATANTSKLNDIGYIYSKGIDIAASKYCTTVCPSVCTSVHASHTNHASHGAHTDHASHDSHASHADHASHASHASHTDHSSHASHADHSNHMSHADHSSHTSHGSHSDHANHNSHADHASHDSHASHADHASHDSTCDCVGDTCYCEGRTCSRSGCTTNFCQE